jgi:hypothetical protein
MNLPAKLSPREIDALEDTRILVVSRAQGVYGIETARKHANLLLQRAAVAFGSGNLDEAIWLAERELNFNCRAFGFRHRFTMSSKLAVRSLRLYAAGASTGEAFINRQPVVRCRNAHVA